jgi:hypothetical protein
VVNHLDDLDGTPQKNCTGYRRADGQRLNRLPVANAPSLAPQSRLTALLQEIEPIYETASPGGLTRLMVDEIADIAVSATGPTWMNRTIRSMRFKPTGCSNESNRLPAFTHC